MTIMEIDAPVDNAPETKTSNDVGGIAADQLRAIVQRIENVDEEIKALQEDRKEILSAAKNDGFCTKTIAQIIRLRKKDPADRSEEEAMLDLYLSALGME